MDPLRALIVDDEPLSRELLRSLLDEDPTVAVIGECGTGAEAIAQVRDMAPDLLFLDVEMPEVDGFAVVQQVGLEPPPVVIFVTAHDHYALRAFDVHAVDYLLKPFDPDRLRDAVARASKLLSRANRGDTPHRILALLEDLKRDRQRLDRLVIRTPDRAFFLKPEQIDWIEASGKYIQLHVGKELHPLREGMARIEQQLDPQRFVRISRSAIINIDRVKEIQPWFQGDYVVLLQSGAQLTSTRGYRENLQRLLGKRA